MRKYVIIETWNGSGYSSENVINSIKEFASYSDALAFCKELADVQLSDDVYEIDNGYGFDIDEDNGSVQLFEVKEDSYGVMIECNVNEVYILNESDYIEKIQESLYAVVSDDFDGDINGDSIFFGADDINGDFDLQFHKLKIA